MEFAACPLRSWSQLFSCPPEPTLSGHLVGSVREKIASLATPGVRAGARERAGYATFARHGADPCAEWSLGYLLAGH